MDGQQAAPRADEFDTYSFGNPPCELTFEENHYLAINRQGETIKVDLRRLRDFYVASNGKKSELIVVEERMHKPIRIAGNPHQTAAMHDVVRRLRAVAPSADRTALRHGPAMRKLGVANRARRWLLYAPLIALAVGIVGGYDELRVAMDSGHTEVVMDDLDADWSPGSRRVTIRDVRLLEDLWTTTSGDQRFFAAMVKRDWKPGDPVFMFVSATQTSQLATIDETGVVNGVYFKGGDTALPENFDVIREKLQGLNDHPITIETPAPSQRDLVMRVVPAVGLMIAIALLFALFGYRRWDKANEFRQAA